MGKGGPYTRHVPRHKLEEQGIRAAPIFSDRYIRSSRYYFLYVLNHIVWGTKAHRRTLGNYIAARSDARHQVAEEITKGGSPCYQFERVPAPHRTSSRTLLPLAWKKTHGSAEELSRARYYGRRYIYIYNPGAAPGYICVPQVTPPVTYTSSS